MYTHRHDILLFLVAFFVCTSAMAQNTRSSRTEVNQALLQALDAGQQLRIVALLRHGADPNFKDASTGRTLLMSAAGWDVKEEIRTLVKYGAYVDSRDKEGDTALIYAVTKGRPENVLLLLRLHANVNIIDKERSTAFSLAKAGLSSNWTTPFLHIEAGERRKCWKQIVQWIRQARKKQNIPESKSRGHN